VVGLVAVDVNGHPVTGSLGRCPYLTAMRRTLAAKCNGHLFCAVSRAELQVNKRQCPGVAAVFIQVTCTKPGGIVCLFILFISPHPESGAQLHKKER